MISRNLTEDKEPAPPLYYSGGCFVFFTFYVCYWDSTLLCLFVCFCFCLLLLLLFGGRGPTKFSSVQGGIYALGKAHMRSTQSLRSFPNFAFETVPVFVWLTMALTRPYSSSSASSCSTPLSSVFNGRRFRYNQKYSERHFHTSSDWKMPSLLLAISSEAQHGPFLRM